jgi:uncharacterized protein
MNCTNLVVKVASRCNLNCTYCYVYNKGDDSYKKQPKVMTTKTVVKLLERIKYHCEINKLNTFLIVFHGGEPLLAGVNFFENFINNYNNIFGNSEIRINFALQTNGTLLTLENLKILKNLNIQIGISLDGTEVSNNINRVYHNNKGSYHEILRGFKLVGEVYGREFLNSLCVIDVKQKPIDVYNHFKAIEVNSIDLLIPEFTLLDKVNGVNIPNVGDWLIEMFNIWYKDNDKNKFHIDYFSNIVNLILGNSNFGNEMMGKTKNGTLVIETNGAIELVDTLKVCANGITNVSLNVFNNNINDIYTNELAKKYYNGHDNLCNKCENCDLVEICGGGFLIHRYSGNNNFDNPTVYCYDMAKLITHIQNTIFEDLTLETQSKIEKININEIKNYIFGE